MGLSNGQPKRTRGGANKLIQNEANDSVDTLEIPAFAGVQTVSTKYQRRTQVQYLTLAALGLLAFYKSPDARLRVLGLSVLFPGAGFMAVGGVGGIVGLTLSVAIFPLSLFAWFGAGGFAFVLANWFIPSIIAFFCAGVSVWEPSAAVGLTMVSILVAYMLVKSRARTAAALKLRDQRNSFLQKAETEYLDRIQEGDDDGVAREMTLEEIRFLQRFIEIALQAQDDFSGFNIVDQFQTSALRYQCYYLQYSIAAAQKTYFPSFQGYIKESQEKLIERSLTQRVMSYWKWESMWGKFSLDWDPVVKDNIMVTGYLLVCLALYEKLNGDDRYREEGALKFDITSKCSYLHDTSSVMEALMKNWNSSDYCLFPCEPNWIYSGCNLIGMEGALAYDSYMRTGQTKNLIRNEFHRSFESEFMSPDGSIVAIRSSMTGFAIPGIAGVLGDVGGAICCNAAMPNLARRLWHMSRESTVRKDKNTDKWTLENLVGADNMDVGNYSAGPGFAWSLYAAAAGEFGEEQLRRDLVEKVDTEIHPIEPHDPATGSLRNKGLSLLASSFLFRGRITKKSNWSALINEPIDTVTVSGPKLSHVLFPAVLVAKCVTSNGKDLDIVLYPGQKSGSFLLTFSNLVAGEKYAVNGKEVAVGKDGKASSEVFIDGRTAVSLLRA